VGPSSRSKGVSMGIQTTVVGSYPKPPDEGKPFVVRATLHALERGEADPADLRRAQDDLVRAVIHEHEEAGIDLVTDGQARWDDILTPFARNMAGFRSGGLLRWFDNNVYYRRPICVGEVEWRGPSSVEDFGFASSVASKPVKAVVPGPVTFARMSLDEHYKDPEAYTLALARVLSQEAFELEAAGARHIQIDEPGLLDAPEDVELARRALAILTDELESAEVTLATYFGDAKRLGTALFGLPVHVLGLDLVAGRDNMELVDQFPTDVGLQAGIVDARNTMLEPRGDLTQLIDRLAGAVGADRLRVSPSAGLEFLPREQARAKLHGLSEAVREVGG
jgi:5-methyltetrahydropteroyltriglutamate--homocysteine methyltransferase